MRLQIESKVKGYIILTGFLILLSSVLINQTPIIGDICNNGEYNEGDSGNTEKLKTSQSSILYSENFNDGIADNWATIGGSWTIENNQYKVTGTSGERVKSYYPAQNFSYYLYEGDFKLVSGNELQIIFNIQDIFSGADQGHYCQITLFYYDGSYSSSRTDTAVLYSNLNYQIQHISVLYDFNYNQWYHFSIISTGTEINFFLNNSLVLSYSGVYFSSGYIGVKSMYGPVAYFDNIIVKDLNNLTKIHINGNSDWADFKDAGNCTGQGTFSDPYVIEDLVVSTEDFGTSILIENSDVYFRIENCTMGVLGNLKYTGIKFKNVSNGQIINTTVSNHLYGLTLDYCNNTIVSNNLINDNKNGIRLSRCNNNSLLGNQVWDNENQGMYLTYSNNTNCLGNDIERNYYGLSLWYYCRNNTIIQNKVIENEIYGISLRYSNENNIFENNISYNLYGLYSYFSDNCNISGNLIRYNDRGIYYYGYNDFNYISKNIITENVRGIFFGSGISNTYNNISENTINFNDYGIYLYDYQPYNFVLGNIINNNNQYGIFLYESNYNKIKNNLITNNYRGIYLSFSSYNEIRFNQINENYYGIYLYYSYQNSVSNNTFSGNNYDIYEVNDEPYYPDYPNSFSFEDIIIIIAVVIVIFIILALCVKIKSSSPKYYRSKYPKERYHEVKKPIIESNFDATRKSSVLTGSKAELKSILWEDKANVRIDKEKKIISKPLISKIEEEAKVEPQIAPEEKKQEEFISGKTHAGYCTNCGKPIIDTWKICAYCGVKIRKDLWGIEKEPEEGKIQIEKVQESTIISPSETPKVEKPAAAMIEDTDHVLSKDIKEKGFEDKGTAEYREVIVKDEIKEHPPKPPMKVEQVKTIAQESIKPKILTNICPFCGFENKPEVIRCRQCGYKLEK